MGAGKAVRGPEGEGVVGSAKRAARREWVEASVSWRRWGSRSAYAAGSVGELSNAARRAGSVSAGAARGGACLLSVYSWSTWETSMAAVVLSGDNKTTSPPPARNYARTGWVVIFGENT